MLAGQACRTVDLPELWQGPCSVQIIKSDLHCATLHELRPLACSETMNPYKIDRKRWEDNPPTAREDVALNGRELQPRAGLQRAIPVFERLACPT